jgi:drug/metabolite transporter (DMT)-like permease
MGVGFLPLVGFWFYSKAIMVEEISRITPLFQFIPIFVVFLSVAFLNEILTLQRYFGIAIIVPASILISYRKTKSGKPISSAFKFMIPFSFVLSLDTILSKYLLSYLDYWSVFFWHIMGSFCGVLLLLTFSKPRKELSETVPRIGKRTFFITFVGEGVYVLGTMCWLIAASLGHVSLVSTFAGLQHFFVFVYMLVVSLFMPKILKEEISKKIIALKISAIALMLAGTLLVTA